MRLKNSYFYTLREDVKDEESVSGNLLVKAGYIKKVSAGVYMLLPLGQIVAEKIENIIRKHMNKAGSQEVKMSALIPSEYYAKSKRLENFGPSVFKLNDRNDKEMILGPTHEELFAYAAKSVVRSYKDLPFNIYQIQTKFRDEPRARFGLIRVKEFVMKDAYSFDLDPAGLEISYQKMYEAYVNIFKELGIDYRIVKADTGMMGGLLSEEFQAISNIGEDILVYCDNCDYAANYEIATCAQKEKQEIDKKEIEEINTPNIKTIEQLCEFFNCEATAFVKTLIYQSDKEVVAVCLRGDRELAEAKLNKIIKANELVLADEETILKTCGTNSGFCGPLNLKCRLIIDEEVSKMNNFITGANKTDTHLKNVNLTDIVNNYEIADLKLVHEGDACPCCKHKLQFTKGIEVGNLFKLGTKYSEAFDLTYLDNNNQKQVVWMGSYGIGVGRCMAAIAEQNNDENGLLWPSNLAPYLVGIVSVSDKDEAQVTLADKLYEELLNNNISALYDDRSERAGVKFKDMELIGIPYRITVGRKANEGIVELKKRHSGEVKELNVEEVISFLKSI